MINWERTGRSCCSDERGRSNRILAVGAVVRRAGLVAARRIVEVYNLSLVLEWNVHIDLRRILHGHHHAIAV